MESLMINTSLSFIDTHLHLWDRAKFSVDWTHEAPHFDRNFSLSEYLEDVSNLSLEAAVYMEVDAAPSAKEKEMEYVRALCTYPDNPLKGAVFFADPLAVDFKSQVKRLASDPFTKGIRRALHLPEQEKGLCLKKEFVSGLNLLADFGLSFDLCMRADELGHALELSQKCPETIFVLDHCGYIGLPLRFDDLKDGEVQKWKDRMARLGERKNVYCKLSGLVSQLSGSNNIHAILPIITVCLESFPVNRIVIGSDWPICTLGASAKNWLHVLMEFLGDLPIADREKILSKNAKELYRLA